MVKNLGKTLKRNVIAVTKKTMRTSKNLKKCREKNRELTYTNKAILKRLEKAQQIEEEYKKLTYKTHSRVKKTNRSNENPFDFGDDEETVLDNIKDKLTKDEYEFLMKRYSKRNNGKSLFEYLKEKRGGTRRKRRRRSSLKTSPLYIWQQRKSPTRRI